MKSSGKLSILTLISRLLGLVREMSRAAAMGTGGLAEAFTAAFNTPNLFRKLFAEGSTAAAFIPTFKGYLHRGQDGETREFLSAIFTVLVCILSLFTALGILSADILVLLFKTDHAQTALLTRIMFPFLAFVSFAAFFQGILNSVNIFTPTGIAPILFNLCWIFLPPLLKPLLPNPAKAMAVAVAVGGLIQALCQLPAVIKSGFRFGFINPARAFRHEGTRRVMKLIGPTILGMAAYEINSLVCVSLATVFGAATALNFSLRLQELTLGVFVASIGTVILPILAAQVKAADWTAYNQRLSKSMNAVSLFTIPIACFCMLAGRDIVSILFKSGAFDSGSVDLTVGAFFFHMLGLFFIGQNRIIASGFYAREDTRSPTFAGIASLIVNILAAWLLSRLMRGPGIALALSLASAFNFFILVIMLLRRKESDRRALGLSMIYALKMLGFALVAGLPIYFLERPLRQLFSFSDNRFIFHGLPLLSKGVLFAIIGIALLALSRDENLSILFGRFKKKKGSGVPGSAA